MITAQEAREMIPDKDTVIHDNVQTICNSIQQFAQKGYHSIYIEGGLLYFEETLAKFEELGYSIRKENNITFIEWYNE